jgi:hypothetical protein
LAAIQPFQPSTSAAVFLTPWALSSSTDNAAVCSSTQAQYVMMVFPGGISRRRFRSWLWGMLIAPLMWPLL